MQGEDDRQRDSLRLIASENYVSSAVLQASASVLTNKYAEGYPGKRLLRRDGLRGPDRDSWRSTARRRLFGTEHANVQPHCGSSANMAVLPGACCEPGDSDRSGMELLRTGGT